MKVWTYRYPVTVAGVRYELRLEAGMSESRLLLEHQGQLLEDSQRHLHDPYRLHRLSVETDQGRLEFELGPRTAWSYGVQARLNGELVYSSHPQPFAYLPKIQQMLAKRAPSARAAFENGVDFGRLKPQLPALAVDIVLGLLFFILGKLSDLRTAALVTAGAGLAIVPLQWAIKRWAARKVDLLGGLALFGIFILLLSAGFSWVFDSEFAVQLKATVIGGLVAACFGVDALFGGRRLGGKMQAYLVYRDLNTRRLSAGMCGMGVVMAGVNLAIACWLSKDAWLWYTLWGDALLAFVLSNLAIQWSRPRPASRLVSA
ncbi:septation protein IspZ [Pelomonas sp. SE-A7]|uniref:septation protein IspZ n=1 Tax=Pelomonas sp. SE-A7 TaxID=3054953 RepID=UPI00259D20D2|nr:septation protein IspZ [Pelomonas sp. SE-A7]MDM4765792.1 septation protein IspZ [Pelomonas sp. SE-A7]